MSCLTRCLGSRPGASWTQQLIVFFSSVKHEHLNKSSIFLLKWGLVLHLIMIVGRQVLSLSLYIYILDTVLCMILICCGLIEFFVGKVFCLTLFLNLFLLNTGFLTCRFLIFMLRIDVIYLKFHCRKLLQHSLPPPKMVLCGLPVNHDRVEANIEKHWQAKNDSCLLGVAFQVYFPKTCPLTGKLE